MLSRLRQLLPSIQTVIAGLCLVVAVAASARGAEVVLLPVQDGIHDVELKDLGQGEWEVRTTGSDPYFFVKTNGEAIDLKTQPIFSFEYFSTMGIGRMLVFVGSVLDIPHLLTIPDIGRSEGWAQVSVDLTGTLEPPRGPVTSLRVTVGDHSGIVARMRAFRARAATEQELRAVNGRSERLEQDRLHALRLDDYLTKTFPDRIVSVTAVDGKIRIEGLIEGGTATDLQLAEVPMWVDITKLSAPVSTQPIVADAQGHFVAKIDRAAIADRDALLSAWAIVRQDGEHYVPLSSVHYVDSQKPRADLPQARPRSLKGLGGCPFDSEDMQDLGIASVTLNIILNDFFDSEPGPGRTPYNYAGRTWYVNQERLAHYDRDMKIAADRGWMVSAIVLITPVRNSPAGSWIRDAAHPDADPSAIFVLPNFTTREGVNAYAAAMNFVAERYSRPDGKYGRIHHWIMHNEINSGFYWASAGPRKLVTYMDLYQKSMRVAWLIARQYDPHAKAFISLDHCWTHVGDPRAYAARELLDRLVDFSHQDGDFDWGVAFHPYPQDITNPRTWEDNEARFAFDTPFLTFRNLEVLDAWGEQPGVKYLGREPREIQLTEQGLNSRDYGDKALDDQAAGLAYAWKKIESLKNVTAFQYHLWSDDRGEGGLCLGLRKFADDRKDPHGKKPSWTLYQAIGTDAWDRASAFAKPIIGIQDWTEILHRDAIDAGNAGYR